jgi:hypothetical protein
LSLLKEKAGYEVSKGKWHLSYAANAAMGNGGEDWGPADIDVMEKRWGWSGWNPPDAGNAIQEWQSTPGTFNGRTLGGAVPTMMAASSMGRASRPDRWGRRRKRRRVLEKPSAEARQAVLHVRVAGQPA